MNPTRMCRAGRRFLQCFRCDPRCPLPSWASRAASDTRGRRRTAYERTDYGGGLRAADPGDMVVL